MQQSPTPNKYSLALIILQSTATGGDSPKIQELRDAAADILLEQIAENPNEKLPGIAIA